MAALQECPICLGPFTDPRMLVCLHTLCHPCLSDHIAQSGKNGEFKCPVCREKLQIPRGGADEFPKNFFMNTYMTMVSDTGSGARSRTSQPESGARGNQCNNTEDDDDCEAPQYFCLECCEYYCKVCSKAHRKHKATRGHGQLPVEELTDETVIWSCPKQQRPYVPSTKKS